MTIHALKKVIRTMCYTIVPLVSQLEWVFYLLGIIVPRYVYKQMLL